MTTLLLLYTEPPTRRVLARHRPGRLILASDEITAEDREVYDECVQLPPPDCLLETLAILRTIRADQVIAQTEYGLLPGALLSGQNLAAAMLCTNKWLCRKALAEAGVKVPRFALVASAREVQSFARRYPIVLKPIASTLARGVVRVDSPDDVQARVDELQARLPLLLDVRRCAAFARLSGQDLGCDPLRQWLVEDFAEGPPLEVDGLVFGDRVKCFGTTEQVTAEPEHLAIVGYMFPADGPFSNGAELGEAAAGASAQAAAQAAEQAARALRACRVRDMGFSIELRGDTVIEVNGRLGEDDGFPDLFESALGSYPILQWIARDTTQVQVRTRAAIAYRNCYSDGPVNQQTVNLQTVHQQYALATHPTSSRLAYARARARLG